MISMFQAFSSVHVGDIYSSRHQSVITHEPWLIRCNFLRKQNLFHLTTHEMNFNTDLHHLTFEVHKM